MTYQLYPFTLIKTHRDAQYEVNSCLFLESYQTCKYAVRVKSEVLLLQELLCSLQLALGTGLSNAQMNKTSKSHFPLPTNATLLNV
jgi:hypothetical protein